MLPTRILYGTVLAGFLATASFGQGVGINTTTPDPSAALDIQSTDKGILIPRVSLQSSVDNTTVPNPANGLLIYNTNQTLAGQDGSFNGEGLYQNVGTSASPNWESVSKFKLPYTRSANTTGAALSITNYNSNSDGNIAVQAGSSKGYALVTDGKVKFAGTGQQPGFGKVLMSDGDGNAKWEGGVAFRVSGVLENGAHILAPQTSYKVPFSIEDYDKTNSYTLHPFEGGDTFVAPTSGIYHFSCSVSWNNSFASVSITAISEGVSKLLCSGLGGSQYGCSTDARLKQGDQVFVTFFHNNEHNLILDGKSVFSGHFVSK